jgi:predicted amidophosphoribosyltransferase
MLKKLKFQGKLMAIHRMKDWSAIDAQETLDEAAQTNQPDSMTQKQAFCILMPRLQNLRAKNFSFNQISKLLEKVGFELKPSTIRSYYSEQICLLDRQKDKV